LGKTPPIVYRVTSPVHLNRGDFAWSDRDRLIVAATVGPMGQLNREQQQKGKPDGFPQRQRRRRRRRQSAAASPVMTSATTNQGNRRQQHIAAAAAAAAMVALVALLAPSPAAAAATSEPPDKTLCPLSEYIDDSDEVVREFFECPGLDDPPDSRACCDERCCAVVDSVLQVTTAVHALTYKTILFFKSLQIPLLYY